MKAVYKARGSFHLRVVSGHGDGRGWVEDT